MRPTSTDMLTWALLMVLLADHTDSGVLGGVQILAAFTLVVLAHKEHRAEVRRRHREPLERGSR